MSTWSTDVSRRVGAAEELQIASRRTDGTLRPYVTIWVVRVEDALYVRSAQGENNPWYRRALASGRGRVRAGGVELDVRFRHANDVDQEAITAAYHAKYDRYGPQVVSGVVSARSEGVTMELLPEE
jgi:hypothetical protein